jgi:uncharacterized protein (DUF1501 family)
VGDALFHPGVLVAAHLFRAQRVRRLLEEEVDARQHALQLVARLGDRLAHFGGEHVSQALRVALHQLAEAGDALDALLEAHARPARLRGAGTLVLGGDALRVVRGQARGRLARSRVHDLELCHATQP